MSVKVWSFGRLSSVTEFDMLLCKRQGSVSPAQLVNTSIEVCVCVIVCAQICLKYAHLTAFCERVSVCVGTCVFPHADECVCIECILYNPALYVCAHVLLLLSFIQ